MKAKQLQELQKWVAGIEQEMLYGDHSTAPSTASARSTPSHAGGEKLTDRLRRELRREEELSAPFYPLTHRNATPRRGNVYERLYIEGQTTARRKQDAQVASRQAAEAQDLSYSYSPCINPSPSPSVSVSQRLYHMQTHYARHRQELREQREDEVMREVRSPRICGKSVEMTKTLVGTMQVKPVEDRLIMAGVQMERDREGRAVQRELEERARASPRISPLASELHRTGDISERLTRYISIYSEHKQSLAAQYRPPDPPPRPRANSASPSRLLSPIKHVKELPREFSFVPEISEKSKAIADRLGTSESRLLQQPSVRVKPEFSEDEQPFQPLINARSEALAMGRESPGKRWEALYREREVFERKKVALRRETAKWDEDADECSFYPLLQGYRKTAEPIYDRLTKQEEARLQHLTELRRAEINMEVSRCSFSPEVHEYHGSPHINITEKKGVDRYFERLAKAQADREEKEKAKNRYNGDSWTNTPTQPHSPRLGARTPSSLKRLVRRIDF